MYFLDKR